MWIVGKVIGTLVDVTICLYVMVAEIFLLKVRNHDVAV